MNTEKETGLLHMGHVKIIVEYPEEIIMITITMIITIIITT